MSAHPLPRDPGRWGYARPSHGFRRAAIRAEGLSHRFGRHRVLDDVTFELLWGRALALIGPNGVGKTTLLRILAGSLTPTRGKVWIDEVPVGPDGRASREACAFLCGAAFIYDDLTGPENLAFALEMTGARPSEDLIRAALARVGLPPHLTAPVRSFSTGMRKRLALARVWVMQPRVLLLDEPYASLDEDGRLVVDRLIRDHLDEGGAVFLASHDTDRAGQICHDVLELSRGQSAIGTIPVGGIVGRGP